MAKDEQWRLIEGVVEALERGGLPEGAVVTRNAAVAYRDDLQRTRQVDVHVALPAGPRTLSIGIEVKDETAPLSVEVVEQVDAKLRKLQLDRRCLVSRSGFSKGGRRDAVPEGLELLTLEELRSVDWWWGPMLMQVYRNVVQVVHVELKFEDPEIATRTGGLPVHKCLLVDSRGDSATLYAYGVHHGIHALKEPGVEALEDGGMFEVQVLSPPGTGEVRTWAALRHGEVEFPPPKCIVYGYRLHRRQEEASLKAYALHDRQALTTSFPFLGGKDFQLTFVGKDGELPGSVGELKMVVGPVKVPKTRV